MDEKQYKRNWLPLGFLTAGGVAGLVALAAAVLIRLELQEPGVQYLVDPTDRPDGQLFNRLGILHGTGSTVFSVLPIMFAGLGYAFVPAALGRWGTSFRPLGGLALFALVVGFGFFIAAIFFGGGTPMESGWTLYPPLSQVAYEGMSSLKLANVGVGLGMLSLALVSVDFIGSLIAGLRAATERIGLEAWAFAFCGLIFLVIAFRSVVPEAPTGFNRLAALDSDPLNPFLLLVSLTVIVSALLVSFRRGGSFIIVPLLFALAYFAFVSYGAKQFLVLTQAGVDRALHDTYYVIAYSHFVFQSASLFAFFAGMYAAFSSIGRQLWLGITQCLLMVVGVAMSFIPQFYLGMKGMPRRYMDYSEAFETWNYVSSLGSLLTLIAIGLWAVILLRAVMGSERTV